MQTASKERSRADAESFECIQTSAQTQFHLALRNVSSPVPDRSIGLVAGYRRWLEFDAADQAGQDFCSFKCDGSHAVMVVADGVSQSFYGDLAARLVGRELLDFLWSQRESPPCVEALRTRLNECCATVTKVVRGKAVNPSTSGIKRLALEATRRDGSQTVLGAGLVDCRSEHGWLFLLGDIVAVVDDASGSCSCTGVKRTRWSNTYGVKGDIYVRSLSEVRSLLLKSDGVAEVQADELSSLLSKDAFERSADQWAKADDVSFVWLSTRNPLSASPPRSLPRESDVRLGGLSLHHHSETAAHQAALLQRDAPPVARRYKLDVGSFVLGLVFAAIIAFCISARPQAGLRRHLGRETTRRVMPHMKAFPLSSLAVDQCCEVACSCQNHVGECAFEAGPADDRPKASSRPVCMTGNED
jgi:hypothetical protein